MRRALALALMAAVATGAPLAAQQVPDREFSPPIARPMYAENAGPRLCLDEAHHNFHTLDDRFFAFGALARRDGYRVAPSRAVFTASSLAACDLLVISNAQPSRDEWDKLPYPTPSAFTDAEIAAVRTWVEQGGQLLLIADHMPLAGAALKLAAAFDAQFVDGFAFASAPEGSTSAQQQAASQAPTIFSLDSATLRPHYVTEGREPAERVTSVRSFTGQAFQWSAPGVEPILVLPQNFNSLEPRIAWEFDSTTRSRHVGGWLQGATRRVGRGRVAMFGEAAMFSAQRTGQQRNPMGMNAPGAEQNAQLVLNVLHWLSGVLEP